MARGAAWPSQSDAQCQSCACRAFVLPQDTGKMLASSGVVEDAEPNRQSSRSPIPRRRFPLAGAPVRRSLRSP
eukprot:6410666-Pyramimonas_sp.AAC.2